MKRILVISPFPPPHDGIGEHTRHLVTEWVKAFHVSVLAPAGDGNADEHFFIDGDQTRTIQTARLMTATGMRRARQHVRKLKPDIVYCQFAISALTTALPSVYAALEAARDIGARVICGFHEPVRETAALPWIGTLLYRAAARRSDEAVCFSSAASESMRTIALDQPIRVVAHGIPQLAVAKAEHVRTIQQRFEDRPIVLALGFIHPDKGADVLIDAAHLLAASNLEPSPVLLIAGSVRARQGVFKLKGRSDYAHHRELRKRAASVPGGFVQFTDYVSANELPALLAATTIAVLPYRAGTQSGIASHTLAAALPVVASDLIGLREQLGKSAKYVPIGNAPALAQAIENLLTDSEAREKLRRHAQLLRDRADYSVVAADIIS